MQTREGRITRMQPTKREMLLTARNVQDFCYFIRQIAKLPDDNHFALSASNHLQIVVLYLLSDSNSNDTDIFFL